MYGRNGEMTAHGDRMRHRASPVDLTDSRLLGSLDKALSLSHCAQKRWLVDSFAS